MQGFRALPVQVRGQFRQADPVHVRIDEQFVGIQHEAPAPDGVAPQQRFLPVERPLVLLPR